MSISSGDSYCRSVNVVENEAYGSLPVIGLRYLLIRIILHLSLKWLEVIGQIFLIPLEVSGKNSTILGTTSLECYQFQHTTGQEYDPAPQGVLIVALV